MVKTDWPIKKLGKVCAFAFGYPFKAEDFNESDKGLPVIRIGDIDKSKTDKFYAGKYDGKYLITHGNILIGLSGSIKISRWQGEGALLNQRIVKLYGFPSDISEDFIFYQLPFSLKELERQLTQGTVKNVLVPHLSNINVLIPTINIQKKIVERLDAIRKAQELCDQQIQKTEELFESITVSAFQDGEVHKLGELFDRQTKTILPTDTPNQDFNFIGLENIESNTSTLVSFKTSKGKNIRSSKSLFQKGNVLYGKLRPYLNKVWLAEFDGICSTDIWVLQANTDLIESLILATLLRSNLVVSRMSTVMTGTNLPRANASSFDNLEVTIPIIKEQQKIVEKLEVVQNYKKLLLKQKAFLKELFDSVLDKSMKGEMDN